MPQLFLYKEAKRYAPSHMLVMNKSTEYMLEMEDRYMGV
jgi:hypothetical protein